MFELYLFELPRNSIDSSDFYGQLVIWCLKIVMIKRKRSNNFHQILSVQTVKSLWNLKVFDGYHLHAFGIIWINYVWADMEIAMDFDAILHIHVYVWYLARYQKQIQIIANCALCQTLKKNLIVCYKELFRLIDLSHSLSSWFDEALCLC